MKWTIGFAAAALVASIGPAPTEHAVAAPPPEECSLALVGDSLALTLLLPLEAAIDGDHCSVTMHWNYGPLFSDTERRLAPVIDDPPDVVVVAIGIWEQAHLRGGHGIDPTAATWAAAYRNDHLQPWVDRLLETGTEVVWVGMHRTRDAEQSATIAALNAIWSDVAADAALTWVDGRAAVARTLDRYVEIDSAADPAMRLVARDGYHLCREGAVRMTGELLDALDTRFGIGRDDGWADAPWSGEELTYGADQCPEPDQVRAGKRRFLSLDVR
ncbi:MAG: hypothetical protein ACR2O6_00585 [Ilumatobacteraceae bacterium]